MMMTKLGVSIGVMVWLAVLMFQSNALGYDVTDKFSVGGVLAGAWQFLEADEDADGENVDGWIGSIRLTAEF